MKLKGRIPVEQLDDERLTNIERRLVVAVSDMAPQAGRAAWSRRAIAFAGVAMAVAVAGVVGWKLHTPHAAAPQPTIAKAEAPYTLSTSSGTQVEVTHVGTRTELAMGKGTLELAVKHDPNRLLVVHAGDTDIEDVGTKFSVDYDGAGHVEVRVTEGEVKVKRAGNSFDITANNAWTTEQGTITIAQLDSATSVVAQNDIVLDPASGSDVVQPTGAERGSAAKGSDDRGSAAGSAAGRHKAGETNLKKAILEHPMTRASKTIADYQNELKTAAVGGDNSRIFYNIAVKQHEAKNDSAALYMIRGTVNGRIKDEAYADSMWLQVRITCLRALDDECRLAAQRYINNIPSGSGTGIADQILKAIVNGQ